MPHSWIQKYLNHDSKKCLDHGCKKFLNCGSKKSLSHGSKSFLITVPKKFLNNRPKTSLIMVQNSSISPLSKEKYAWNIIWLFKIVNCYKEKLNLYFAVVGIWVAANLGTWNGKWLE